MSEPKETGVNSKAFQNDDSFDPANFDDQDPLSLDAVDDEWEQLVAERDQLKDRLMRSLADAENTRKRLERDRRDAETYGGSKLARDMLPVYDNMQRALEAVDDNQREASKALIEGIELTLRELLNTFSKHKIERVSPEIGEKFDPQVHQAMFEAPVPGIDGGKVIQMLTDGFVIGDRLLRPAQVGVSSAPPKS
ncbi:MAG: nucleotide exchange factor GrpE [Rhodobacterales bacterium]|jgi:molecular chaperone GrpE|nr:nucleotide exchange factor GrpE [Pseudomonadota bacterium]MDA1285252.1 nucleotide exchange factor GrpE [Pseudomonadota bacterium]